MLAHDTARAHGGVFLLRIEDIDQGRCRPEFEAGIVEDLAWLGLRLAPARPPPVRPPAGLCGRPREAALARRGLSLFPHPPRDCTEQAMSPPRMNAGEGPDGLIYHRASQNA
jgi:glutamyl-Q tRNA(Asp) synthetase